MYIVRFVRKDNQPDEEYYYRQLADATYHFSLFVDDDSNLYSKIEVIDEVSGDTLYFRSAEKTCS